MSRHAEAAFSSITRGEGFYAQPVPTDAEAERKSPLPSSGLRETPDATLPSRGGILRAVRSDGRKNGTSSTPKSFPSRGRWRRRRRKRCRTEQQFLSTDAKAERKSPLPSSGLRETPDATLPSRGGILRPCAGSGAWETPDATLPSRGGILRGVQASWGNRRSTASRAAACSARFLLVPVPCPTSLPLSRTRTEKVLSWSGPVSPVSS